MDPAYSDRGSMANPPSLYDTSTSTAESWSTGSHQGKRASSSQYPSHYYPKTRPTGSQSQPNAFGPPPPAQTKMPSSPQYANWKTQYYNQSHHSQHRTQSEPGTVEHERFSAYVNRFAALDQRYAHSEVGPYGEETSSVSEKIRKYNQRYPDPAPSGMSDEEEENVQRQSPQVEQRQAASPLAVKTEGSPQSQHYKSRPQKHPQQQQQPRTPQSAETRKPKNKVDPAHYRKSPASSASSTANKFRSTPIPVRSQSLNASSRRPSPRVLTSSKTRGSTELIRSPSAADSNRRSRSGPQTPRDTQTPSRSKSPSRRVSAEHAEAVRKEDKEMEQLQDQMEQLMHRSFQGSVETPISSKVQDLKRQLWDENESLQVSIPPTLSYAEINQYRDRRQSQYNASSHERSGSQRPARGSRSLSPGRRNPDGDPPNDDQKFKSKFYEAALAARMRGKVYLSELDASSEYFLRESHPSSLAYSRSASFSERSKKQYDDDKSATREMGQAYPVRSSPNKSGSGDMVYRESPRAASEHMRSHTFDEHLRQGKSEFRSSEAHRSMSEHHRTSYDDTRTRASPSDTPRLAASEHTRNKFIEDPTGAQVQESRARREESRKTRDKPPLTNAELLSQHRRDRSVERRGRDPSTEQEFLRRDSSLEPRRSDEDRRGRGASLEPRRRRDPSFEGPRAAMLVNETFKYGGVPSYWQNKTMQSAALQDPRRSPSPKAPSPQPQTPLSNYKRNSPSPDLPNEKQYTREERSSSGSGGKDGVADLVARLNAVRRDTADPHEALAIIDSILKQESRSSNG